MIWKLIPIALLADLTACASGTRTDSSPPASSQTSSSAAPGSATTPSGPDCDAQPVQNLVGQKYSDSVGNYALRRSNSGSMRLLKPGQVMTMEYNAHRLNIILEGNGSISALRCG